MQKETGNKDAVMQTIQPRNINIKFKAIMSDFPSNKIEGRKSNHLLVNHVKEGG